MLEVDIIRTEIFVVESTTMDEKYGKLTITDKEGRLSSGEISRRWGK